MADLEEIACVPVPVDPAGFNRRAVIPYGVTVDHVESAMAEFITFLGFINVQLHTRDIARFETMLMPANFSSLVGEFMGAGIPKYCATIAKNTHHNGHPDMLPAGRYPRDDALHAPEGIEIKASRYASGWQGHNAEDVWLMIFVFASGRPTDVAKGIAPAPFRFLEVLGAQLEKADWAFAGRSETSRRTITASVTRSGRAKMSANWIYRDPGISTVGLLDDLGLD